MRALRSWRVGGKGMGMGMGTGAVVAMVGVVVVLVVLWRESAKEEGKGEREGAWRGGWRGEEGATAVPALGPAGKADVTGSKVLVVDDGDMGAGWVFGRDIYSIKAWQSYSVVVSLLVAIQYICLYGVALVGIHAFRNMRYSIWIQYILFKVYRIYRCTDRTILCHKQHYNKTSILTSLCQYQKAATHLFPILSLASVCTNTPSASPLSCMTSIPRLIKPSGEETRDAH